MTASHPQYFIVIDSISPHSNSQLLTAIHCDEPNTGFEPRLISAHFFCPLVWLAVTVNLGGVEITIDRLKVCADLSNPESQYNFYYVVMEYTVANNTESDCYWEIHRTGNIYGSFSFDGYDRYLGGNHNIKDKEIVSEWRNKSSLRSNEKVTCSMALIVDREMDDPPKGLMLRHNSKMTITLPIKIDNVQNEIVIDLNED